jgi:hypothetical protein
LKEILDALQIGVKLAFLNGAFRFSERFALLLFCRQRFFRPQADEIALQLGALVRNVNFTLADNQCRRKQQISADENHK